MNYEQKYKDVLERAKKWHNAPNADKIPTLSTRIIEEIFPELRESEDDKIRKELIKHLKDGVEGYMPAGDSEDYARWLAWVEKQGKETSEKEFTFKALPRLLEMIEVSDRAKAYTEKLAVALDNEGYHTDAKIVRESIKIMNGEEVSMATMDEQKPVDNIEPKFKVGDFIVNDYCFGKVIEITNDAYLLDTGQGIPFSYEHNAHLWTIEDAKDGDTLINKNYMGESPFIFKETKPSNIKTDVPNPLTVFGYCGIGGAGFTKSSGWGDTANCIYHPATKEQSDTLLKAMAEAGYEWDDEKKELKKIKQKSQRMVSAEAKEALYDKPAWSKEDEYRTEKLLGWISTLINYIHEDAMVSLDLRMERIQQVEQIKTWLKSLRPQNNITDEELAQAKKDAYNDALDKIEYHSGEPTFDDGWDAAIWYLKKRTTQPQSTWKPSDEQIASITCAVRKMKESACYDSELVSLLNDLNKLK